MKFAFLIFRDFAGREENAVVLECAAQIFTMPDMDVSLVPAKSSIGGN